jgi:hypothetical protein
MQKFREFTLLKYPLPTLQNCLILTMLDRPVPTVESCPVLTLLTCPVPALQNCPELSMVNSPVPTLKKCSILTLLNYPVLYATYPADCQELTLLDCPIPILQTVQNLLYQTKMPDVQQVSSQSDHIRSDVYVQGWAIRPGLKYLLSMFWSSSLIQAFGSSERG